MTAVVVLIAALISLLIAYFHRNKIGERWFTAICFVIFAIAVLAVLHVLQVASIRLIDILPNR